MSYTVLAVIGVLAAVAIDTVLGTKLVRHRAFWVCYAIMLGFQLIVNGVLTGLPVVRYDGADIVGWRLARAPVEDLVFGFALILITLSAWVRLSRPRAAGRAANPADR